MNSSSLLTIYTKPIPDVSYKEVENISSYDENNKSNSSSSGYVNRILSIKVMPPISTFTQPSETASKQGNSFSGT